ncbi:MAG: signal peptidase II [Methylobacteriaceae bacterium]|nr:signal peptidase II [Methylobacteriaceae bacterium]MBV9243691.1 signal peptidase II [Methylobacteriaceae bacterium]
MTWFIPMFAVTAVVVADQVSKALVVSQKSPQAAVVRRRFLSIRTVLNRHGALGSLVGLPTLIALWAGSLAIAVLVLRYGQFGDGFGPLGVGLAIGGASGNVLDRLYRGSVVDFIAIGPWPVFNLADTAIVAGAGLLVLSMN